MLGDVRYIIVLANEMDASGALNVESTDRADYAGKLALDYPQARLITPGWGYRSDSEIRIGDSMKGLIVERFKISPANIVSHLDSKDTVGDAVFCREFLDVTGTSYSVEIVTSDYHCNRAQKIFRFVFGELVEIGIHAVSTENPESKFEAESLSTEAFQRTFAGIAPGDFKATKERLFQAHPLYVEDR
jgi:uncharacterized SAM-binding protein YcdF (DUF218 family)